MKVKKLIKLLQELPPEHQELELISSIDDEGNGYNRINFEPEICYVPEREAESYGFDSICHDDKDDLNYWAGEEDMTVAEFKKKAVKFILI